MRRTYTKEEFIECAEMVRAELPESSITTDVICGYPGEDDYSHEETKETIEKIELSDGHVFPYSKREGTSAFLKNQLDPKIKSQRSAELRNIIQENLLNSENLIMVRLSQFFGRVKIEKSGLTDNYIRVKANHYDTCNYPFSSIEDVRLGKLENNVVISKLI